MARYLVLWEIDESKLPLDPKEKKQMLLEAVEQEMRAQKGGMVKDWGLFAGEMCGYSVLECSETDLTTLTTSWKPVAQHKVMNVLTIKDVKKAFGALPEK